MVGGGGDDDGNDEWCDGDGVCGYAGIHVLCRFCVVQPRAKTNNYLHT